MRLSVVTSGVVATVVGIGSSLPLLVAAAQAVGATPAETSSWVTGLFLAVAATSAYLSVRHRIPIVTAWSTPGAALIASSPDRIGMSAAVGAFILSAVLILATAAIRPLGNLIARIPASVAAAMLAGILLRFVVAAFDAAQALPLLVLPLIALYLLVRLWSPAAAVLVVLVAGIALAALLGLAGPLPDHAMSNLVLIAPAWDAAALIGLGVPLYLVTMASQNLPGFAVIRAAGYEAPSRSILAATGLASLLTAPFGAHATNAAAITAAICTGPDVHPDPARRWPTGIALGACYLLLAGIGASLVALLASLPPQLIVAVAGLALIAPLAGALGQATEHAAERVAAIMTLAVTVSGIAFFGIGSAFWGLLAGLAVLGLDRTSARSRPPAAR